MDFMSDRLFDERPCISASVRSSFSSMRASRKASCTSSLEPGDGERIADLTPMPRDGGDLSQSRRDVSEAAVIIGTMRPCGCSSATVRPTRVAMMTACRES